MCDPFAGTQYNIYVTLPLPIFHIPTESSLLPLLTDVCGVRVEQEAGGAAVAAEGGQGRGEARHLGLPRPPHPPAGKQDIYSNSMENYLQF